MTTIPRFIEANTERTSSGCWRWLRACNQKGYALSKIDGKTRTVHRWAYEAFVGPIPEGLQLDHLCHTRRCVNPAHLEPVTSRENTYRSQLTVARLNAEKTHCKRGHAFTDENTRIAANGSRCCRACAAMYRENRRLARAS